MQRAHLIKALRVNGTPKDVTGKRRPKTTKEFGNTLVGHGLPFSINTTTRKVVVEFNDLALMRQESFERYGKILLFPKGSTVPNGAQSMNHIVRP
uniref:Doublecortin domain-containing protein n=1 Tax=Steinernema glaseri TaxID=37863 RepID=A0A1I7Z6P5_9BILA